MYYITYIMYAHKKCGCKAQGKRHEMFFFCTSPHNPFQPPSPYTHPPHPSQTHIICNQLFDEGKVMLMLQLNYSDTVPRHRGLKFH